MSTGLTVAIVIDGALHAYHRDGSQMVQVAQLAVEVDVDPAALAAVMADLGDLLGWQGGQPAGAAGSEAGALPAAPPAALPPAPAKRPKAGAGRPPAAEVAAQRAEVLAVVAAQPGIMRADIASQLGLSRSAVKRRTDELLAAGLIDAAALPGVRQRGPGGGHGLFARMVPVGAPVS